MEFDLSSFVSSPLEALLSYSASFDVFTVLNSNGNNPGSDIVAAFGMKEKIRDLSALDLHDGRWKFGYIAYDRKNAIEKLSSANPDRIKAPEFFFYEPKIIVIVKKAAVEIISESREEEGKAFRQLQQATLESPDTNANVQLQEGLSKEAYLQSIGSIKERIRKGDIYEMNFCMEFFAEQAVLSPAQVYKDLNAISEAPFSFYARFHEVFAIGSSPERFLRKEGSRLITQPIKGTAPRSADPQEDAGFKEALRNSEKEQNENVMIVDVSRNDLSRIAKKGSVKVDELFGVYSFRQVHQMISTVSCELKENCSFQEIVKAAFPPASMTGAPKIRAMQIIEETENFKRGIYSGTLGFISPEGDFDLNVVIRSILYNQRLGQVSYAVGSAVTDKCQPEEEYRECLLKARAMRKVLERS
jgi:para-aminobenzoate synthetase component 1